jgi:hypothetical protein
MLDELQYLWNNKTRHGANRQKFGPYQETILESLTHFLVPEKEWPDKAAPLQLDATFKTYCKTIMWNAQKNLGKKITKEKSIRHSIVSLSEFDHVGAYSSKGMF